MRLARTLLGTADGSPASPLQRFACTRAAALHLLGSAVTNGAGSIIVADFNGDGLDDLILPVRNESRFIWKNSTAWISRPGADWTSSRSWTT